MNKKNALIWNEEIPSLTKLAKTVISDLPTEEQKRIRNELLKTDGLFSKCGSFDKAGFLSNIILDLPNLTNTEKNQFI